MKDLLLESKTGTVTRLALNAPATRNALSMEMIKTLQAALDRLAQDPATHVIILAAEGPVFCPGHDLKEISSARAADDNGRVFFEATMAACSTLMQSVVRHPKIIIAEVQGVATAAGCQLVASCDLAVASTRAGFATPGVNIGLFCSTPMVALSRNVSRKHAMEMLLTGEINDAEAARDMGLVNHVVAPENLTAETQALADKIASKSPKTLKIGKEAFYAQAEMPLAQAYEYAGRVMVENLMQRDSREGIGAFLEKRAPNWEPLD
ncbi:MAG: enoyl-CoA hydratase [Silicimonas sp.]|nr:enoyl-CoA hydratase [Silicimonas sp.]